MPPRNKHLQEIDPRIGWSSNDALAAQFPLAPGYRQDFQGLRPGNGHSYNAMLEAYVVSFDFACVPTNPPHIDPAGRTLLHWRVVLVLQRETGSCFSVGVDVQKFGSEATGWTHLAQINWKTRTELRAERTFKQVSCPSLVRKTLRDVISMVTSSGLAYYNLSPQRSGCLNWVRAVAYLLQRLGWIRTDSLRRLDSLIIEIRHGHGPNALYWCPDDRAPFHRPPVPGLEIQYTPDQLQPPDIHPH